jgi:hypothetical protein
VSNRAVHSTGLLLLVVHLQHDSTRCVRVDDQHRQNSEVMAYTTHSRCRPATVVSRVRSLELSRRRRAIQLPATRPAQWPPPAWTPGGETLFVSRYHLRFTADRSSTPCVTELPDKGRCGARLSVLIMSVKNSQAVVDWLTLDVVGDASICLTWHAKAGLILWLHGEAAGYSARSGIRRVCRRLLGVSSS